MIKKTALSLLVLSFLNITGLNAGVMETHAISMHGVPKHDKDFKHFDYVNNMAVKGGELKMASFGTYDTFNPFNIKGIPASGVSYVFDTLLQSSYEEAFTEYGLVAKTIAMPEDKSFIEFTLNEKAKFHDGKNITPEDVIFSFEILRDKGSPVYSSYYKDVEKVIKSGEGKVKFVFKKGSDNAELPLILGQLPVLPKHFYEGKDFEATTLKKPLGSGPYMVDEFEQGRFVTYKRVKDYWAKDLPVNVGRYNFDKIRFDYYRDTTVALEALKSGAYDLRIENEAKKWALAYNEEKQGFLVKFFNKKESRPKIIKGIFNHDNPSGMQGFVMNTRKEVFQNRNLRKALMYAFDFEWANKSLFYDSYKRTKSYFDNSELASKGLPNEKELEFLNKYKDELSSDIFDQEFKVPVTNEKNTIRDNLEIARNILKEAGYTVDENGVLKDSKGVSVAFELLLDSVSAPTWERVAKPFTNNLKRLGIDAKIRVVDVNQYQDRLNDFDYDMIVHVYGQSLSPGNEQTYFFGSEAKNQKGSQNYAGVSLKSVDDAIALVLKSKTREELIQNVKLLDRILLFGYYVVPHWHLPVTRIAYLDKFNIPSTPMKGVDIMSWEVK